MSTAYQIPKPVKGDDIFKIDEKMFVRFAKDGFVEEIGHGSKENYGKILLEGMPGTGMDDLYATRYYDLYSGVVMIDIHSGNTSNDKSSGGASVCFKDLVPGSAMFERVRRAILISNHYFQTNISELPYQA